MRRLVEGYHHKQTRNTETASHPLTPAERDVLLRRLNGAATDKAVAEGRGCSVRTVKIILYNLREKLSDSGFVIRKTADVVNLAVSKGWIAENKVITQLPEPIDLTNKEELCKLQPMREQQPVSFREVNDKITRTNNILSKVQGMAECPGGQLWPASLQHQTLDAIADKDFVEKAAKVGSTLGRIRGIIIFKAIPFFKMRVHELLIARVGLAEQNLQIIQDSAQGGLLRPEDLNRAQGVVSGWRQELRLPEQPTQTPTPVTELAAKPIPEIIVIDPNGSYSTEDIARARGINKEKDKRAFNNLQSSISLKIQKGEIHPERVKIGKTRKLQFNAQDFAKLIPQQNSLI